MAAFIWNNAIRRRKESGWPSYLKNKGNASESAHKTAHPLCRLAAVDIGARAVTQAVGRDARNLNPHSEWAE